MRPRALRWLRSAGAAVITGCITMAVAAPTSGATTAPTPRQFVSLHGAGAWSITGELVDWQNELVNAPSYIDLNYTRHGSGLGREDLALGNVDFAISGLPFSADELKNTKGGAGAFIDAPIQVASLATFVEPTFARPVAAFITVQQICDPDADPSTWPPGVTNPDDCIVRKPYTGPVRIPTRNLAAMYLKVNGTDVPRLPAWNNPAVLQAWGLDPATTRLQTDALDAVPGVAGRSDPDETTYYLQQFIKQGAPDIWQARIDADRRIVWEPISERMPVPPRVTRDGAEQQVNQLASSGNGVDGVFTPTVSGGLAGAPPATLRTFKSAFPTQAITFAQLQNGNGDWVAPTADSINKAVAAGGDSPLYALTNPVPGAYPIVWVDRIYVAAHGLSIAKTEGLAMLIRYLATTGQEKERAAGDGRLTPALVAQALSAANQVVISNCVGPDRRVVTSADPGPLAPPTATAMKAIGTMLHCEPIAAPSTTTTVVPTTSTTPVPTSSTFNPNGFTSGSESIGGPVDSSGSVPGASSSGPSSPNVESPSAPSATGTPPDESETNGRRLAQLVTATNLPLPVPLGAGGVDRLATFLLGAALYLVARKPVTRLVGRVLA